MQINFVKYFKISILFSSIIFTASFLLILFKGLNYGIDFKGGTLMEINISEDQIKIEDIRGSLDNLNLGDVNVKQFGQKGNYLIKIEKKIDKDQKLIQSLKENFNNKLNTEIKYRRTEAVGPKVSAELLKSGLIAISLSLFAMLFYIWIRFEWQFSLGSIVALIHDVLITVGIFSLLSIEINLSIIAAVLTIVGYSMNDTVVIYDRIRENLNKYQQELYF